MRTLRAVLPFLVVTTIKEASVVSAVLTAPRQTASVIEDLTIDFSSISRRT